MRKVSAMLYFLALSQLIGACDDGNASEFVENHYHSIAVIKDDVMEMAPTAAKNVRIYLTNVKGDTTRYALSTTTDSTGGFFFNYLPKDKENYFIYAHYISKGVMYQSQFKSLSEELGTDSLEIVPRYDAGVKLVVRDSVSGNILPGAMVCLYNSEIFADEMSCDASIDSQTTNNSGVVFFGNLKPSGYIAVVDQTIGAIPVNGFRRMQFSGTGLHTDEIKVQQNGIAVRVTDEDGDPISAIDVCLFTSKLLASDTLCSGSVTSKQTSPYGYAHFNELKAGRHYLVVNDTIKTIAFKGLVEVDYVRGKYSELTFQLKSKKLK